MILVCPLLMQARASIVNLTYDAETAQNGKPLYTDPSTAPGVACIGSRCVAWCQNGEKRTHGRCGMVPGFGQTFADPVGVGHDLDAGRLLCCLPILSSPSPLLPGGAANALNGPDPVPASVTQATNPDGTLRTVEDPRGAPPKWCPLRCSPAVVFLVPA